MRTRGAARRGAGGGVGGDEQSVLRSAHGERIINDVLEKLRGKVLLSRAMADLLPNRADAYARFYFRVRALQGVVQRPVSVHLFFSTASTRSGDVLFLRRQSRTHPERAGSSRLQVAHARCIFFYAVIVIVVAGGRARSFRRVEK